MTETPSSNDLLEASEETEQGTIAPRKKRGRKERSIWAPLLTLLLLVILAGLALLWLKLENTQQQVRTERELAHNTRSDVSHLGNTLKNLEAHVSGDLTVQIQGIQNALNSLRDNLASGEDDWIIAEAEYLMHIANDRLLLERDVPGATAALETADLRLSRANDPSLLSIRRTLSEEIAALRNVEAPDYPGIALTLNGLANSVNSLPLTSIEQPEEEEAADLDQQADSGSIRKFLREIWREIKSLVVIKRKSESGPPLLLPDERYFLRQNLRLTLENAETAVLRRSNPLFQSNINSAAEWIQRYYDSHSQATIHALDTLKYLSSINLEPELPAITESLAALKEWRKSKKPNRQIGRNLP